jgi:RNA polymerase sigma-70 factor (ECF subfamily)
MHVNMRREETPECLVAAARAGDRDAFERLVANERGRIRSLLASRFRAYVVLGVEAEDVYQETLLRAWRSAESFSGESADAFVRWLGGIGENVLRELARRRARDRRGQIEDEPESVDPTPSCALRREERLARLERSLEGLRPEYREVVLLTRVRGLSFAAAGERMGRTPDAAKQLLYRALKELRARFGDTQSLGLPDRPLGGGTRDPSDLRDGRAEDGGDAG